MAPRTLFLTLSNLLLVPLALVIFALGFFPYKPSIPGLAAYEELGWEDKMGWTADKEPEPQFDRLVFMVVDALRSDFVFGEGSAMAFVQSLIRSGAALPFTSHASSPTITQPRVKAMTTGSVPSFLDLILNFFESDTTGSLADQDTWLAQMRAKEGGKLVMYGDDTWLKLFPDFFGRAEGTTSFFVSDFTEVDNNVTRHVPSELNNPDWNALILHYLGLDHIGHKTGPNGPHMLPKQEEMDEIVKHIYTAIEGQDHLQNTLFVLCGDHGMNDAGGHGASSPGETSPALVFMSPKMKKVTEFLDKKSPVKPRGEFEYHRKVKQSDIVPTLAGLLGFPVPKNNLGVFIKEFLHFWDDGSDRIRLLLQNAQQIKKIVAATFPRQDFSDVVRELDNNDLSAGAGLAQKWQRVVQAMSTAATLHPKARVNILYTFLQDAQDTMSTTASNYNVPLLILGSVLAALSSVLALVSLPSLQSITFDGVFYSLALGLYCISMFASSYVEEEHNFWYYITGTWLLYLFARNAVSNINSRRGSEVSTWAPLAVLGLHRLVTRWNQTGQKFAGADDIVHAFPSSTLTLLALWLPIFLLYLILAVRLSQAIALWLLDLKEPGSKTRPGGVYRLAGVAAASGLVSTALVFKLAFTARDAPELTGWFRVGWDEAMSQMSLVLLARGVFAGCVGVVLAGVAVFARRKQTGEMGDSGEIVYPLLDILTLFLITQTKAQNIPLYLIFTIQNAILGAALTLSPNQISLTALFLAQTAYFASANNNAISSVDLSNAYNGVSGYNAVVVGVLVFVSNWAGPIWWSIRGIVSLSTLSRRQPPTAQTEKEEPPKKLAAGTEDVEGRLFTHVTLLTLWLSVSTTAVMVACTALRTHLFVWSVFSPKFLMQAAWAACWHLCVNMVLGSSVWALCR